MSEPTCGKYDEYTGDPRCEEGTQTALGVLVVVGLVLLVVCAILYRLWARKHKRAVDAILER